MARIPDWHEIGNPDRKSMMAPVNVDGNAMAAPGRAQAAIGEAIAQAGRAIGGAIDSIGEANDKNQQFKLEQDFANFQLQQEDKFREAQRNIPEDGQGFRSSTSEGYFNDAKGFLSSVPDKYKQDYDLKLRRHHIDFEQKAREIEYRQQDEYTIKNLDGTLQSFYGDIQSDPTDKERLDANIKRGETVIDNSPLPQNRKGAIMQQFRSTAEEKYFEGRRQAIEDMIVKGATSEDIEKAYDDLDKDIRSGKTAPEPINGNDAQSVGPQSSLEVRPAPITRDASVGRPRSAPVAGMVIHETQGAGTVEGNLSWSNKKNTGANYYVDKDGSIYEWAPDNIIMNHAGVGRGVGGDVRPDLLNGNTIAVEIVTRPGEKPNEAQIAAVQRLAMSKSEQYGFSPFDIEAHGRLAPGHKEASEGTSVVDYIRENWNGGKTQVASLDGKMRLGGPMPSPQEVGQPQPKDNGIKVKLSAYSPQAGGDAMEGGYAASKKGPDGKAEVRTLDDVASGKSNYVTLAGNPRDYGKAFVIPEISYVGADGETRTLKNVRAVVHDTGSAFKNAPEGRFDVAIAKDATNKQMAASHGMWAKAGLTFIPEGPGTPVSARGLTQYAGLEAPKGPGAGDYLKSKFGGQVADASGATVPADGTQAPAAELPHSRYVTPRGVEAAAINDQGRIATILDGIPDNMPLSKLPGDVQGQVTSLFPKEVLKPRVMPDGSKVTALDAMNVGQVKEAFASTLRNTKREIDATGAVPAPPTFRYITPQQRDKLVRQIEVDRRNFYLQQGKAEADFIKQYGEPRLDAQGRTLLERAEKVLLPNQITKLRQQMDAAKWQYNFVKPLHDLPEDEIGQRLDQLQPMPSDSQDVAMMKAATRDAATREADRVRALRQKDPALSVERSPEVQDAMKAAKAARETYTMGQGQDGKATVRTDRQPAMDARKAWETLIEARIAAQERVLGEPYDTDDGTVSPIRILRKDEAVSLLGTNRWSTLSEEEQMAHLQAAAKKADATYGKYARRAFNEAVRQIVSGQEGKDQAAALVQKMVRGEAVSNADVEKYSAIQALSPMDAFTRKSVPDQFDGSAVTINGLRMQGGAPAQDQGKPAIMQGQGPQSFSSGNSVSPSGQMGQVVQWFMQDPAKRGPILDAKLGAGTSQKLMDWVKQNQSKKSGASNWWPF